MHILDYLTASVFRFNYYSFLWGENILHIIGYSNNFLFSLKLTLRNGSATISKTVIRIKELQTINELLVFQ